jgi:hypothetical protein
VGRPSTVALLWARTLAQHLGTELELARGEAGGSPHDEGQPSRTRIEVKFL